LNPEREADTSALSYLQSLDVTALDHIAASLRMTYAGQGLEYTPPEIFVTHIDSLKE
jgi:hypothetical protein